ncbi:VolA/Pla-1 family phospholipase [Thalassotalea sp. PLHSN55]|uniref:VolA/Pla-1 family phospholipase n=1 Tax=Thalassotalea sp. PLHSN55 TaxID=3435888 RepID=UPI003F848482
MKKLVLSLAVISALGLSACDSESLEDAQNDAIENDTGISIAARVKFDPSNGDLSVPNDLLFLETTDGTLNPPVDDPTDGSDPFVALSALDGWSTVNPFVLDIIFPEGKELDGNSVFNPESVRIFKAVMGGDTSDEQCASVTRGLACKIVSELAYTTDFITQKSGDSVAVIPLKPLEPKTTYILVMTDSLQDDAGNAIAPSTTYELVQQDINTSPLGSESQLALQGVINSFETAVASAGVDKETIIYSAAITTQSTSDVLDTVKSLLAAPLLQGGMPPVMMIDPSTESVAEKLGIPSAALELNALYSTASYHEGTVTLPYYLGIPSMANPQAPVNEWWTSLCDSGAMLAGLAATNPEAIPSEETPLSVSDGQCIAIAQAAGLPWPGLRDLSSAFPLDTERNLTKFSPVPAPSVASDMPWIGNPGELDVQMTTPVISPVTDAVRAGFGLPALTAMPENGWPVVMLQHGITSKKEDMLAITGVLSAFGYATVAIDHPLHGSRGFDLDFDGTDDINASTVSATHYMNLASLLTTRDNLRQSTADLLGLRFALNATVIGDGTGDKVDASNVHFLGHSLGAITGINFLALTNSELDPALDGMFAVDSNSLAMPGVMVANFLMESGAFANTIKSSLAYAEHEHFQTYIAGEYPEGATAAQIEAAYIEYVVMYPEEEAILQGTFSSFAFAAQTVTDSGDPVNYASRLAATQTPTHLIEVVGNGVDNLSDQVIPNTVSTAPLGGTEGAIALLGLDGVSSGITPGSGAVRFLYGSHSSILSHEHQEGVTASPEFALKATEEMQGQVAGFFSSGAIVVTDDTLVN